MNENVQRAVTLAKRNLVDSIWKSAVIEGLGTTFQKTEAILDGMIVNTNSQEVLFIINMRSAWYFLFNTPGVENNLAMLRELNKICGVNLIYGSGDLRVSDVSIGGCTYVPPIPVYADVVQELKRLASINSPVERAIETFCYVAKHQLFIDGNKRVAQLICNKILIENGIGILSIDSKCISDFKYYLVEYYDDDDSKKDLLSSFLKDSILYTAHSRVTKEMDLFEAHTEEYKRKVINLCEQIGINSEDDKLKVLRELPSEDTEDEDILRKRIVSIVLR